MDITVVSRLLTEHLGPTREPMRLKVVAKEQFKVYVPALDTLFISSYGALYNAPQTSYGIVQPNLRNRFCIKLCKLTKSQRWIEMPGSSQVYSTFFHAQEIENAYERMPVMSWSDLTVNHILCRLTPCSNK